MPRSWRSHIADEVRATSRMKPKWEQCYCSDCEQDSTRHIGGELHGRCTECGSGRTITNEILKEEEEKAK